MSEHSADQDATTSRHDDSDLEIDSVAYERVQSMASDNVFEPGPSFVDNDRPTDRLAEMPAWLQTFAATAIEKGEMPADEEVAAAPEQPEPHSEERSTGDPDPALPDWLRDDAVQSQPQAQPSPRVGTLEAFDDFQSPQASGTDTFISEDDLPDWLRAFSEETSPAPSVTPVAPRGTSSQSSSPSSAAIVRVPPVENIWLSTYERQSLGPGPTLFALLASNTNGETAYPGVSVDDEPGDTFAPAQSVAGSEPAYTAGQQPETAAQPTPQAAPQRNSMRLLLLTLCVVAVLVLISVLFLS